MLNGPANTQSGCRVAAIPEFPRIMQEGGSSYENIGMERQGPTVLDLTLNPALLAEQLTKEKSYISSLLKLRKPEYEKIFEMVSCYNKIHQTLHINAYKLSVDEITVQSESLVTLMVQIAGFADEHGFKDDFSAFLLAGGKAYASPSIKANYVTQLSAFFRIGVSLSTELMTHDPKAAAAVTLVGSLFQLYVTLMAPFWSGSAQSTAVSRQAHVGPAFMPNVKSQNPDRRTREELLKIIWNLENKLKNCNDGEELIQIKKELGEAKIDLVLSDLYLRLNIMKNQGHVKMTKSFGNVLIGALSIAGKVTTLVSTAYATLSIQEALYGTGSEPTAAGNYPAGVASSDWKPSDASAVGVFFSATSLLIYAAQCGIMHYTLPSAVAEDLKEVKIPTQMQIIALSDAGKLPEIKVELYKDIAQVSNGFWTKLDKIVKGPMAIRLEDVRIIIDHDINLMCTAVLSYTTSGKKDGIADIQKLLQEFRIFSTPAGSNGVSDPRGSIDQLVNSMTAVLNDASKASVQILLNRISALQEASNAASSQDIEKLLKCSELTPEFIDICRDALTFAALKGNADFKVGDNDDKYNRKLVDQDRKLADLKGSVERNSLYGNQHQVAQKIGIAFAWMLAGPASPNTVKALCALIGSTLALMDPEDEGYKQISNYLSLGGSVVAMIGGILGIFLAYTPHFNVQYKNDVRQKDVDNNIRDVQHSGALSERFNIDFGALPRLDHLIGRVSDYSTLTCTPIDKILVNDVNKPLPLPRNFHYGKGFSMPIIKESASQATQGSLLAAQDTFKENRSSALFVDSKAAQGFNALLSKAENLSQQEILELQLNVSPMILGVKPTKPSSLDKLLKKEDALTINDIDRSKPVDWKDSLPEILKYFIYSKKALDTYCDFAEKDFFDPTLAFASEHMSIHVRNIVTLILVLGRGVETEAQSKQAATHVRSLQKAFNDYEVVVKSGNVTKPELDQKLQVLTLALSDMDKSIEEWFKPEFQQIRAPNPPVVKKSDIRNNARELVAKCMENAKLFASNPFDYIAYAGVVGELQEAIKVYSDTQPKKGYFKDINSNLSHLLQSLSSPAFQSEAMRQALVADLLRFLNETKKLMEPRAKDVRPAEVNARSAQMPIDANAAGSSAASGVPGNSVIMNAFNPKRNEVVRSLTLCVGELTFISSLSFSDEIVRGNYCDRIKTGITNYVGTLSDAAELRNTLENLLEIMDTGISALNAGGNEGVNKNDLIKGLLIDVVNQFLEAIDQVAPQAVAISSGQGSSAHEAMSSREASSPS